MSMKHGTTSMYTHGKCRCDECREANVAYYRRWREANREKVREQAREGSRRYREANPEKVRESNRRYREVTREQKQERHAVRRAECIEILGGVCVECGSTESLEFDHVDPSTKSFTIASYIGSSWDKLMPELMKCQLLCVECHKAKTFARS